MGLNKEKQENLPLHFPFSQGRIFLFQSKETRRKI